MEPNMNAYRHTLRASLAIAMASLLTGCIVIPSGHRYHHGHVRVLVPVPVERGHYREDRYGRDHYRGERDDHGPWRR